MKNHIKNITPPPQMEIGGFHLGRRSLIININIVESDDGFYEWDSIEILPLQQTYEGITAALINAKYSNDEMQAITNNMTAKLSLFFEELLVGGGLTNAIKTLKDTYDDSNSTAFKDMQIWRKEAKEIALQALEFARENGLS